MSYFDDLFGFVVGGFLNGAGSVFDGFFVQAKRSKGKGMICGNACFTYVKMMFSIKHISQITSKMTSKMTPEMSPK